MTINDNVEFILKRKGLDKITLAAKLGMSTQNLGRILHGNTTLRNIERVAETLNVKPAELLADPPLSKKGFFRERVDATHAEINCPVCGAPLKITLSE